VIDLGRRVEEWHALESEQCDGGEDTVCLEYEQDNHTMSELCQSYGIARETGYVWLRRYRQTGLEGRLDLNRAPQRHPN
jgi:transposase